MDTSAKKLRKSLGIDLRNDHREDASLSKSFPSSMKKKSALNRTIGENVGYLMYRKSTVGNQFKKSEETDPTAKAVKLNNSLLLEEEIARPEI